VARPDSAVGSEAWTSFALDLYRRLAQGDGNLVVSPSSVAAVLAMVLPGARGETAAEIAGLLHWTEAPERLAAAAATLDDAVLRRATEDGIALEVSNAVWIQEGMRLRDEFAAALSERFRAALRRADFQHHAEAARQAINQLVAEQTHDKIQELFVRGALDSRTRLALTNAIYLQARWRDPFDPAASRLGPFHLPGGGTVEAPMLRQRHRWRYAESEGDGSGWQALELPYQGGGFAMVVLLPTAGGFEAFQRDLDLGRLATALSSLAGRDVRLTMPKFRFEATLDLSGVLKALGMPAAFSAGADFSGITADEPLQVQTVVQKAYVEVDERGTTAAAATGIAVRATAMAISGGPVEFRADRPFLFLVRHLESRLLLIAGRVADPTA